MNNTTCAIVLAAGRGSRMKLNGSKNKVTYNIGQKPMIRYTIDTINQSGIKQIIVVVGFAADSVKQILKDEVAYVHQDNPQGTGHAVKMALPVIPAHCTHAVIMYGDDSAFYTPDLLSQLVTTHIRHKNDLTLVSIHRPDPAGLGRIVRNKNGSLAAIVEDKNATDDQKRITEINTGLYCFNTAFLKKTIPSIKLNPISHEYYLTEALEIAITTKSRAEALLWKNQHIWHGVNTLEQLRQAETQMMRKNAVQ